MKTIRRLYFYLVAFVSLEVVTWALISLVRSIFDETFSDILAGGLAFILVGLPVFLFHWRVVQRESTADSDERFSGVRAVFLYAAWISLTVPVVQNLLAIILRLLANLFDVNSFALAFGGSQSYSDNLVAIIVNTVLAGYIYSILKRDWEAEPRDEAFPLVRRIARYLWVIYGLALGYAGVLQQLLYVAEKIEGLGSGADSLLVNGLGFTLIGVPLWLFCWRIAQTTAVGPDFEAKERHALVRFGVLYGLTLLAALASLLSAGSSLTLILKLAIIKSETFKTVWGVMGTSLSIMIPSLVIWIYHWGVLRIDIGKLIGEVRQHSQRRLYYYVLSLAGLAATFISLHLLITLIVEVLFCSPGLELRQVCTRMVETQLPNLIAALLVSVPVWVLHWRPAQRRAVREDEIGENARSSLLRKGYLYLVLFAGVIGTMITTGGLLYDLLSNLLNIGTRYSLQSILSLSGTLILFLVFTFYHWRLLRQDGKKLDQSLAVRHSQYPVLLVGRPEGLNETFRQAMADLAPNIPLTLQPPDQPLTAAANDAKAAIFSADILTGKQTAMQEWLRDFQGDRLALQGTADDWLWLGQTDLSPERQVRQAVKTILQLADSGEARAARSLPPATVVGYFFGGLLGLIVICVITSLLMEMFA